MITFGLVLISEFGLGKGRDQTRRDQTRRDQTGGDQTQRPFMSIELMNVDFFDCILQDMSPFDKYTLAATCTQIRVILYELFESWDMEIAKGIAYLRRKQFGKAIEVLKATEMERRNAEHIKVLEIILKN